MGSKHYLRLRLQIVTMTLCFSLIPLFALGITLYYQFHKAYTHKVTEALRTLVQNRRSAIELFFDERISQLTTVANTQTLERLTNESYLADVFNIMQARSKSFIDLGVIDQDGNHLAYVGPHYEKLKSVNYAHENWFAATMSSGVYVSDVFLGFRKTPHFIIAVSSKSGNKAWILRATINSDIIDNIVRGGQAGKRGEAFVVNRNNILQTPPRFNGKVLETPKTPDFATAIGTSLERITFNGEDCLYATSEIANPRWVLVIKEDLSEAMAPLFETRYVESLVIAGGILLVVLGTVFTTRAMTNELIRMERDKAAGDEIVMQSSKMAALGKMAAGVAHEINNPLQIIGDQAGWMKDLLEEEDVSKSANLQEFEGCVNKILRHVERCRSITHRLLRFGRRMEPTQEMVDVNAVVAETITFLETEARFREIEIRTSYDDRLPRITTDQAQLQQVFLNIIDNAIDAVGKSGYIDIRTTRDPGSDREVIIEISDSGPGIPKETLARIFDPFFTTKKANEGTGLGLSISYSIVEKLGGRILVASEESKGTTFTIRLPVM
jgi:two-component system, NtrC family, sensor kinase